MQSFDTQAWYDEFSRKLPRSDLLAGTKRIVPRDASYRKRVRYDLIVNLLGACHAAAMFQKNSDASPNAPQRIRNEIQTFEQKRASAAAQVKRLSYFLKEHPHFANDIGARVVHTLRGSGISINGKEKPEDYLFEFCFAAESALDCTDFTDAMKSPSFMHNIRHGCIVFPRKLGKSQLPSVETMLAFHLVFLIRKTSLGEYVIQVGEPMPKNGKPHYVFVARLINAALGTDLNASDIKSRLDSLWNRNSGAGLCPWHIRSD